MSIDRMRVAAADKLAELGYAYSEGKWQQTSPGASATSPAAAPIAPRQTRQDFVTDLAYAVADIKTVMYRHGFRRDVLKRIIIPIADEQRFVSAVRGSYAYGHLVYSAGPNGTYPGVLCTIHGVEFSIA